MLFQFLMCQVSLVFIIQCLGNIVLYNLSHYLVPYMFMQHMCKNALMLYLFAAPQKFHFAFLSQSLFQFGMQSINNYAFKTQHRKQVGCHRGQTKHIHLPCHAWFNTKRVLQIFQTLFTNIINKTLLPCI